MKFKLRIWRQPNAQSKGKFEEYELDGVSADESFLEMLDLLNEQLIMQGVEPVAFDHDCREGICGMCGVMINGIAHGPKAATTTCQLHMRTFKDGDQIVVEPWRAAAFPVLRDLVVERTAFDRIIQSGGLYFGLDRQRAGRQHPSGAQAGGGHSHGRGGLHRLRSVRGGMPQLVGDALHRGQDRRI